MPVRPSPHFTWEEFGCHDYMRTTYPIDLRETRGVPLALELERIRLYIGPFSPDSVYRTWAHHAAIYAAMDPPQAPPRKSQHLEGRAADVPCPRAVEWREFERAILRVAYEADSAIRYVKFYPAKRFAHVDIRHSPNLQVEGAQGGHPSFVITRAAIIAGAIP